MTTSLLAALAIALLRGLFALHGYLHTQGSFPRPLSREEEADCLGRLRAGDAAARARLIEHNMRLVAHVVKKYESSGEDPEDLISIGAVGLIKAIETYDPAKGTRLATYAARCIENEVLMALRAARKSRGEVFLQEPIGKDRDGDEIALIDVLADDAEPVAERAERKIEAEALWRSLSALDARERRILALRYGLVGGRPRTQQEIARILGISRSYVSRIEKKAIRRLGGALLSSSRAPR
ncbi:MAG: RNA polymerase sporulation sigma factor SigK [Clostridia bacterium]|nr:RNA polymerase sporulation sigma factor SigK [Clostridia bacterium]